MKNEKKYIFLITIIMLYSSFPVFSQTLQGWGSVSMSGEIIDIACSIDTHSVDQTIDMGLVSASVLRQSGKAPPKPFSIELIDCLAAHDMTRNLPSRSFQLVFDGATNGDYFSVTGEAKGIQLALYDSSGELVIPGRPVERDKVYPTVDAHAVLNYELQLVADNKPLKAGTYNTLISFRLEYY